MVENWLLAVGCWLWRSPTVALAASRTLLSCDFRTLLSCDFWFVVLGWWLLAAGCKLTQIPVGLKLLVVDGWLFAVAFCGLVDWWTGEVGFPLRLRIFHTAWDGNKLFPLCQLASSQEHTQTARDVEIIHMFYMFFCTLKRHELSRDVMAFFRHGGGALIHHDESSDQDSSSSMDMSDGAILKPTRRITGKTPDPTSFGPHIPVKRRRSDVLGEHLGGMPGVEVRQND